MTTQHYVRAEFPVPPRFWEPLVTYAFLAAHTTTLRFGTGVLVLPMRRDIVVTAKQIATLDHLSNGRLEIGVGVGAYREEFEALNPDSKTHRGDMVEEGVRALQLLFSEQVASFDGKYYKFKDVELFPKPKQARLPIYFGGNNPAHLRRTAECADGWMPAGLPLDTLRRMVGELKADDRGNRSEFLRIAGRSAIRGPSRTQSGQGGRALSRKPDVQAFQVAEEVDAEGAGCAQIGRHKSRRQHRHGGRACTGVSRCRRHAFSGLFFAANSVSELLEQMQMFAEEVRPKIK